MALLVPAVLLLLVALMTGRMWLLVVAAITWPLYIAGVLVGWWGDGVGDGWEYALITGTGASVSAAAVGIVIHRMRMRH